MSKFEDVMLLDQVMFLNKNQVWPVLGAQSKLCIGKHFNHALYETSLGDIEMLEVEINDGVIAIVDRSSKVTSLRKNHNIHAICDHDYYLKLSDLDHLCVGVGYELFSTLQCSSEFSIDRFMLDVFTRAQLTPGMCDEPYKYYLDKLAKTYKMFGDVFIIKQSYAEYNTHRED